MPIVLSRWKSTPMPTGASAFALGTDVIAVLSPGMDRAVGASCSCCDAIVDVGWMFEAFVGGLSPSPQSPSWCGVLLTFTVTLLSGLDSDSMP